MSMPPYRIGQGYDCHALVPSRPLIIGGVKIPHPTGLLGHSDADVLLHAITDALLGAAMYWLGPERVGCGLLRLWTAETVDC
jgi:2-C-methyl-D-erythritol 2,4-cyclodiphosphate synthase